jgi:hypothetical protein
MRNSSMCIPSSGYKWHHLPYHRRRGKIFFERVIIPPKRVTVIDVTLEGFSLGEGLLYFRLKN